MGWTLFYAGITKVLDPEWSAGGFLLHAIPEGNPLMGFWAMLAEEWLWLIDPLNAWGLTLVGLCILVGAFVRWAPVSARSTSPCRDSRKSNSEPLANRWSGRLHNSVRSPECLS